MKKPKKIYLEFLDNLREMGETNIVEIRAKLINEFDIGHGEAKQILVYWAEHYDDEPEEIEEIDFNAESSSIYSG